MAGLGSDLPAAIDLVTSAARPILERWFEADVVQATLATDAIIGTFASISSPGTAYVLLHHVMGEAGGARGVWGYVQGGMGGLADALESVCRDLRVDILREAEVIQIVTAGGQVRGVGLVNGTTIDAPVVASSVDAHLTFERFLCAEDLPAAFRRAVLRIDYASASAKINLAVSEPPTSVACRQPASPLIIRPRSTSARRSMTWSTPTTLPSTAGPAPNRFSKSPCRRQHAGERSGNVARTCRHFWISRQAFYKWKRRYEAHGEAGLYDRARTPHRSPRATPREVVSKILYLRQNYHFGPSRIADYLRRFHDLSVVPSSVHRILGRHGMSRLPANQKHRPHTKRWKRYEKAQPGLRLQMDVKFLERIPGTRKAPLPVHRHRRLHPHSNPQGLRRVQPEHGDPLRDRRSSAVTVSRPRHSDGQRRGVSVSIPLARRGLKALFMTVWRPSTRSAENSCGIRQG